MIKKQVLKTVETFTPTDQCCVWLFAAAAAVAAYGAI